MRLRDMVNMAGIGRFRTFLRDESGVMAPLMIIFFVLTMLMGGIAVDMMRFEAKRVALQQTIDRATLAAANLENVAAPADVVASYFDTAGVSGHLTGVEVLTDLNSRSVKARATVRSGNAFMSMMSVPYLDALNISQAEQRLTDVEISLVLDISGSMASNNKITNLKTAASEFIDTVLEDDTHHKISISIVPYNGHVNLGPTLFAKFNVPNPTGTPNSYCLDFPTATLDAAYSTTSISRTAGMLQVPLADSWSTTTQNNGWVAIQAMATNAAGLFTNVWCQPSAATFVMVHSNNAAALKAKINGLIAVGATSIDLGMKWGSMLLDPASNGIVSEMAAAGQVNANFANRPGPFHDNETMKVIVLMTDGSNFTQERYGDAYRAGPSTIWRANDGNMSSFHASKLTGVCQKPFWVPHNGTWQGVPWNGTANTTACYSASATYTNVTLQTWQAVWGVARVDWVAWQLYARALGTDATTRTNKFNEWRANFRSYAETGTMDTRLNNVCGVAKSEGMVIYGIAFEAPDAGVTAIRNCASSPASNYFFDATGLEIRTAFRMIAANISQLRLTQ